MPYTPDPTDAAAPLDSEAAGTAAAEFRALKGRVNALVTSIPQSLFPVGSIYINAVNSTNPATLLGFGTWVAFGAGRVPVGFDSGNPLFDAAEETGGSANAAVVSHDHTYSSTTGTGGADHTHSFSATTGLESASHTHSGTTNTAGNHSHTMPNVQGAVGAGFGYGASNDNTAVVVNSTNAAGDHSHTFTTGGVSANHTHSVSGTTGIGGASHTHSVSGTTAATGSSGANANYQPYITVYMWKRTA